MALFQLPHHFEALRCMAIERLWDGEQGREPMHHLMGDIMGYCRKAELTLDCPTEEILVDKELSGEFIFMDDKSVYEAYHDWNDMTIRLRNMWNGMHSPTEHPLC
ncbi:hypothetical protein FOZ62_019059 [Perkinsus olseni]|uniref:Uncharacterized protein n=1 Tax=Perkinsus olseni TaxID=32597 RepID=A0A7J6PEX8_PEROL|nr:hypothetical protein FOZ62_019059 [Perkinsus olseni]